MDEHVILVDERNSPIGTCAKHLVHQEQTPLHRGFSCFLFDDRGRLLLQQRSSEKKTWPLVWSNSCCGHPQSDEALSAAIRRRLRHELRIEDCVLYEVLPDYRYLASYNGTMENEFCPVWIGWTTSKPVINKLEVESTRWIDWHGFVRAVVDADDHKYDHLSCWCREETQLLYVSDRFQALWSQRFS